MAGWRDVTVADCGERHEAVEDQVGPSECLAFFEEACGERVGLQGFEEIVELAEGDTNQEVDGDGAGYGVGHDVTRAHDFDKD